MPSARQTRGQGTAMNDTNDEQPDRSPIPRAWREEFDGLKPIRPIAYESPAERSEHARKASLARWAKRLDVARLSVVAFIFLTGCGVPLHNDIDDPGGYAHV